MTKRSEKNGVAKQSGKQKNKTHCNRYFNLIIKIYQRNKKLFSDDVIIYFYNSKFSVFRKLSFYGTFSCNLFPRKGNTLYV